MDRRLAEVNKREYTFVTPAKQLSAWPLFLIIVITGSALVVGFEMASRDPQMSTTQRFDGTPHVDVQSLAAERTQVAQWDQSDRETRTALTPTTTPYPTAETKTGVSMGGTYVGKGNVAPTVVLTPTPKLDYCYKVTDTRVCIPYGTATPSPAPTPTPIVPFCRQSMYMSDTSSSSIKPCRNEKALSPWT